MLKDVMMPKRYNDDDRMAGIVVPIGPGRTPSGEKIAPSISVSPNASKVSDIDRQRILQEIRKNLWPEGMPK